MQQLLKIQSELKVPKKHFNNFGKYPYRTAEDIQEAAKPVLAKYGCTLILSDDIKTAGSIIYVESTAKLCHEKDCISVTAQAGIDVNRKGMDIAQSFGTSSSYARKNALKGLFLLDDSEDPDATNTHGKDEISRTDLINLAKKLPADKVVSAIKAINEAKDIAELERIANRLNQLKNL
jgi:hypothetical protein